MAENVEPVVLKVFVGGYMGPSYSVRWEQGTLVYESRARGYEPEETVELHPSPEQWAQLWQALEEIGVWEWQARYENLRVVDGTHWSIEIEIGGRRLTSHGSNAYPGSQGQRRVKSPFDRFCAAVSRLVDGRAFR